MYCVQLLTLPIVYGLGMYKFQNSSMPLSRRGIHRPLVSDTQKTKASACLEWSSSEKRSSKAARSGVIVIQFPMASRVWLDKRPEIVNASDLGKSAVQRASLPFDNIQVELKLFKNANEVNMILHEARKTSS